MIWHTPPSPPDTRFPTGPVVPPGLDHYETTVPIKANGTDLLVLVQAALDRTTRTFTLHLQANDPATGWFPENPLLGLLYPNDDTGRGTGSLSYTVRPMAGFPSGTVIDNRARIIFDSNDPIDTPLVRNTLDAAASTSSVATPSATVTATTLNLQWSGQDEAGGSGIASYDVFVSVDDGAPLLLYDDTTATSGSVIVVAGHTYAFSSIATDNVGHIETIPATPDAVITVVNSPPTLSPIGNQSVNEGGSLTFTAVTSDPDSGQVLRFSSRDGHWRVSLGSHSCSPTPRAIALPCCRVPPRAGTHSLPVLRRTGPSQWLQPARHSTMPRDAFATYRQEPGITADDLLTATALERAGVMVTPVVWDAPDRDWSGFDLVVIRSTWDYFRKPDSFRRWIQTVASRGPRLCNPPEAVLWNIHKRYLLDLAARGITVVPTEFLTADDRPDLTTTTESADGRPRT